MITHHDGQSRFYGRGETSICWNIYRPNIKLLWMWKCLCFIFCTCKPHIWPLFEHEAVWWLGERLRKDSYISLTVSCAELAEVGFRKKRTMDFYGSALSCGTLHAGLHVNHPVFTQMETLKLAGLLQGLYVKDGDYYPYIYDNREHSQWTHYQCWNSYRWLSIFTQNMFNNPL